MMVNYYYYCSLLFFGGQKNWQFMAELVKQAQLCKKESHNTLNNRRPCRDMRSPHASIPLHSLMAAVIIVIIIIITRNKH